MGLSLLMMSDWSIAAPKADKPISGHILLVMPDGMAKPLPKVVISIVSAGAAESLKKGLHRTRNTFYADRKEQIAEMKLRLQKAEKLNAKATATGASADVARRILTDLSRLSNLIKEDYGVSFSEVDILGAGHAYDLLGSQTKKAVAEYQESRKLLGQLKKDLQSSIQKMEIDVSDLSEKQKQKVLSFSRQTRFLSTSTTAVDGSFHITSPEGACLFAFVSTTEDSGDGPQKNRKSVGISEAPLLWLIPIQENNAFINLGFNQNSWATFVSEKP